ncbi:MAG: ATP synthase subunit I [Lautropia sp.]
MLTAILLQLASVSILALGAWLVNDMASAAYVVLGGLAASIPNMLFALRLSLHRNRSPESYPVVFFIGEFAKIGLTLFLMYAVIRYAGQVHGDVRWLALMIGLIVALKAPLFALALHKDVPAGLAATGTRAPLAHDAPHAFTRPDEQTDRQAERHDASKLAVGHGTYHPAHAANG